MEEALDSRYARLGEAIAKKRAEEGLTQRQLAGMIGHTSSHSYVYRIEQGKVRVSFELIIKIADALNVKVSDLIDF
ncbi:helix-turn-helix transcriptional regulator [Gordonibacter sp.]|nr:helix-turn-helix transcriptional regulator [Gordonibacter sp.]HIW75571.1 helix-turn-helix domain-containing protein [Candidatus Gordonibacter avicola]